MVLVYYCIHLPVAETPTSIYYRWALSNANFVCYNRTLINYSLAFFLLMMTIFIKSSTCFFIRTNHLVNRLVA